MIRIVVLSAGITLVVAVGARAEDQADMQDASPKALQSLLSHLKSKGVELKPVADDTKGSYVKHRFTVGPDHGKQHIIGLNFLPPLSQEEAKKKYAGYSLPWEFHGDWAIIRVGGPGGNGTAEYVATWKRFSEAMKGYDEQLKIESLIKHIDSLDAKFIRNGAEHDAKTAAKFLRGKWDAEKDKIKTARDFIDKVATKSSTSGRPYLIRFKDGKEKMSAEYLADELAKIEKR